MNDLNLLAENKEAYCRHLLVRGEDSWEPRRRALMRGPRAKCGEHSARTECESAALIAAVAILGSPAVAPTP